MAESVRPRFAVDLDEIERQLAHAQSEPVPGYTSGRNDPLAELARIVGQDDPFQSILAADRATRPASRDAAVYDDIFVARDQSGRPHAGQDPRHSFDPRSPTDLDAAYAEQGRAFDGYRPESPQHTYSENEAEQDGYPDANDFDDPVPQREYPRRDSRKTFVAVGAVIGAAVLGIAGALMVGGSPAMLSGGEPPLIKAMNEPTKVVPQSPGGMEFPNQNKQIYERAGQDAPTKVVNREEQPIDVRQATRTAAADATGTTAPTQTPSGGGLALGEPRKVRTISIRPDGTLILPDSKPAMPASVTTATPTPPVAPSRAAAPSTAASAAAEAPLTRVASATPTTPAPRAAAATPATSGGSSPQTAPAPVQSAPQRVASAQPIAVAAAPQPADATPLGGFSVQLGVSGSEGDAKATLQRFQQKFTALDGKPSLIRKAEVNGNTVYRVRVGPMPREEASSLCSKIQGQGGQCFVAKN